MQSNPAWLLHIKNADYRACYKEETMKTVEQAWKEYGVDDDRPPSDHYVNGWLDAIDAHATKIPVPLTDEQILKALSCVTHETSTRLPSGWLRFVRAIEAVHGITGAKPQQPAPAAQEPLTWEQFKAITIEACPGEYTGEEFDAVLRCDQDELMKGVRMVERFHGITGAKP